MDFIVGMFLMILVIVALLNFATISISDSPQMAGSCSAGGNGGGAGEPSIAGTLLGNLFGTAKPLPTAQITPMTTRPLMGSDYSTYFF
jgi:hypothetical protein